MYLVVFRNRKRSGIDSAAYSKAADAMEILAKAQPGYRSFKSFTAEDGEVVAISEWESENAARAWGRNAEHAAVQAKGRSDWYAEYHLLGGDMTRIHRFP